MQTIDDLAYEPLDKVIDFSHMNNKKTYQFDMPEKMNFCYLLYVGEEKYYEI